MNFIICFARYMFVFCCVAIAALSASIVSSWMTDHGSRSRRGFERMTAHTTAAMIRPHTPMYRM